MPLRCSAWAKACASCAGRALAACPAAVAAAAPLSGPVAGRAAPEARFSPAKVSARAVLLLVVAALPGLLPLVAAALPAVPPLIVRGLAVSKGVLPCTAAA